MRSSKMLLIVLVGSFISFASFGCAAEQGLRTGWVSGLSSAVAALVEAPVNAWIDANF